MTVISVSRISLAQPDQRQYLFLALTISGSQLRPGLLNLQRCTALRWLCLEPTVTKSGDNLYCYHSANDSFRV